MHLKVLDGSGEQHPLCDQSLHNLSIFETEGIYDVAIQGRMVCVRQFEESVGDEEIRLCVFNWKTGLFWVGTGEHKEHKEADPLVGKTR